MRTAGIAGADWGVEETFDLAFGVVVVDLDFAILSRDDTCLWNLPWAKCRGEVWSCYIDPPIILRQK